MAIHEDAGEGRSHRDQALAAMASGAADVLVAARLDRLCETRMDLAPLLARSRTEGWRLMVADFWIDTATVSGRRMADFLAGMATVEAPRLDLPLPPPELRYRVSGTDTAEGFEAGGHLHALAFGNALATKGLTYHDFSDIYDFGCGCGRVTRHLVRQAPGARIYGSDIDEPAIAWLRAHLPAVDARVNEWLPPLPHASETFDLVIGFSVFTHLDEDYQDAWLRELWRVTKPGATLLLTVNGALSWAWHREGPLAGAVDLDQLETALERDGFLFWRDDGWARHFPDYYHTSFHLPAYLRSHWASGFDVHEVLEGAAAPTQDIVVLTRKPEHEIPGSWRAPG
jgi:SAM-dependent methyltransferase